MCEYTRKGKNQGEESVWGKGFQTDEATQAEGQPQLHGHEDGTGRNA